MFKRPTAIGAAFVTAGLLGACVQQQTTEPAIVAETTETAASEKKVTLGPAISTVKPGASVTFSHNLKGTVDVGDNRSVTVTVNEGYPSGTLYLTASAESGVSVFGAEATSTRDMSDVTTHTWRIDFAADAEGVHYIDVAARVEMDDGFQESRAYAVRVQAGDWQSAQAKVKAESTTDVLPTGERAVIMPAEETTD